MSLSQRIKDAEGHRTELRDKLTDHLAKVDDTNVSDADLTVTQEINEKLSQVDKQLSALHEAEKHLATTSSGPEDQPKVPAVISRQSPRPFNLPTKKTDPMEWLIRAGVIQLFSHHKKMSIEATRLELSKDYPSYGDDATKTMLDYVVKAAVNPAMTSVAGWAQELVQQVVTTMMETLHPKSVFPRLSSAGLSLTFGRNGKIIIPTRNVTPTIAGSFVGEGSAIPVRKGAFSSQTLTPKKMAVITTWTREIDEHSVPAIEGLLRDAIQEDTAVSLDSILLDSNAATTVRPAGILNGVAALTATAGGGFAALVGDIKQITGALLTGTSGNIRNPVWLMNPQQVLSAGLTPAPNSGVFPFQDQVGAGRLMTWPIIDSGTVPLGTVIAIDAADFVSVGGDAPRFEVSDQATLHEEDTTPLPIASAGTPNTVAAPVRSLWQTDSLALRLILPLNWTIRRTGVVAWTQNVTW